MLLHMRSCNSHVGRIGGQQFVNMMPWCFPTIHEIMHALGFGHEENRRDRDYYIYQLVDYIFYYIFDIFKKVNIIYLGYWERNNLPTYGTPMDPSKQ